MAYMNHGRGTTLTELSIRVAPQVRRQIDRELRRKPHLSMNAFLNEIIIEKLDALALGAKK
jgi:hypothetical protein